MKPTNNCHTLLLSQNEASCNRQLFGERTAAYSEGYDGADGMPEIYREAALAHLAVSYMHLALSEVLFHRLIALQLQRTTPEDGRNASGLWYNF